MVDRRQGREVQDAEDPAVKEGREMHYEKRPERPATRAHVVGPVSEFPDGSHRVVDVGGRQIGVFNIRGTFHALPNICPHQTGPVCEAKQVVGTLLATERTDWDPEWVKDGEVLVCPWHGLEYHIPTGQCLAFPNIKLRRYDVSVEDDQVVIHLRSKASK
jgi:nitrite reductase/ring-hydroxylating ferredoxin subunit